MATSPPPNDAQLATGRAADALYVGEARGAHQGAYSRLVSSDQQYVVDCVNGAPLSATLSHTDLLRIIRKGPAVKNTVDEAIDRCAEVYNLRDAIEEERTRAEQAADDRQKRSHASKGIFH